MLTVDKSLERLRAMHAKSSKGGGEDFEGSRISYAVVYDKAKLTQVKVRGGEWESTQERKDRKKDKNKEKDNSSHPKKTTSRSETFFVPSSTSMQSEEVLIPGNIFCLYQLMQQSSEAQVATPKYVGSIGVSQKFLK